MSTTSPILFTNVAGGWTDHEPVTRRICNQLWATTETFTTVTKIRSDVIVDYTILLEAVSKLGPGESFEFVYFPYDWGTHLHLITEEMPFDDVVRMLDVSMNEHFPNYWHCTVSRSGMQTGEYGQTWGGDMFDLTLNQYRKQ